jgi:hypothetical protein
MHPSTWALIGFAGGLATGMAMWARYQDRHQRSLFSAKPRRRLAALSRLAAEEPTVDTMKLLREYVAWERHPRLRRRGQQLLAQSASLLN